MYAEVKTRVWQSPQQVSACTRDGKLPLPAKDIGDVQVIYSRNKVRLSGRHNVHRSATSQKMVEKEGGAAMLARQALSSRGAVHRRPPVSRSQPPAVPVSRFQRAPCILDSSKSATDPTRCPR